MLGKRQRSVIGKISELLVSAGSSGASLFDAAMSPRGPLDMKTHSPRGLRDYDLGGVGLGIVAAMEKPSGWPGSGVRTRYCICNPTRVSRPGKVGADSGRVDLVDDDPENYTYVTSYDGPNYQPCTKVFYDGREYCCSAESTPSQQDLAVFPTSEFLSSCHSCGKKLEGEDIYMYRGEKAFCSTECRSRQIVMDERKERCRSDASRSVNLSSSPYSEGQIFSAGILAL
ncbi:FCS-Like Zinc finger 13-like [Punica granatum]|uniref:FLZ-type domain-containing protein n=2 Tax=Punica granatum TaxID=22663 RepID=A0A218WND0_PUNGR|nr:FCS-Like Zinc finger 13-like [Punica granatum]OWM74377.1 hypothetical protein CDL15_Pgr013281 [Punica granatum]PKI58351.1 hypothetical protein CRG98_021255 [Punica granatum]